MFHEIMFVQICSLMLALPLTASVGAGMHGKFAVVPYKVTVRKFL